MKTSYDLDNAVGYWSLGTNDAVSTTIFDGSGEKNDGTSANTPVFTYDQNGVPNQGFVLNGTTDFIDTNNKFESVFQSSFTIEIWVEVIDGVPASTQAFYGTFPGSDDFINTYIASGKLYARYKSDGDGIEVDTATEIFSDGDNGWQHIVVVFDAVAKTGESYVNGISVATGSNGSCIFADFVNTTRNFYIGGRNVSDAISLPYTGTLSDCIIYSEAKSSDWVLFQYLAGRTTAGIVADGTNLVTNGTFDTDSDWVKGSQWTISGGTANYGGAANSDFTQANVMTANRTYNLSFKITVATARMIIRDGDGTDLLASADYAIGNHSVEFTSLTNTSFRIRGGTLNAFSIDNIVVTDITNQQVSTLTENLSFDSKMKTPYIRTGLVLDISANAYHGTPTNITTNATHSVFNGTSSILNYGDIGIPKTLSFWINLDSITESILEETAGVGVSVSSGTMSYGSWDNCFIDGVDTDTITTGWHHVTLTSTTAVTMSAFRFGLITASYLGGNVAHCRAWTTEQSNTEIVQEYERYKSLYQ